MVESKGFGAGTLARRARALQTIDRGSLGVPWRPKGPVKEPATLKALPPDPDFSLLLNGSGGRAMGLGPRVLTQKSQRGTLNDLT